MPIVTTENRSVRASASWQTSLRTAVRDVGELIRHLGLAKELEAEAAVGAAQFPVLAPLDYIRRMRPRDPADPLLQQILPHAEEAEEVAHFDEDPVDEQRASPVPGVLRKYAGRALMVVTETCAIHCRYCFRRHFPYPQSAPSRIRWQRGVDYLAQDETIDEVILSGGDPLTLPDSVLAERIRQLEAIPHLRRLRVHTRLPIVIPERVTDDLIDCLRTTSLTPILVVHANHPAELHASVRLALTRLLDAGLPVLNQSVLLRGVNDCVETLAELSRQLINLRVIPYYLHQLDRVAGAAHFEVPIDEGRRLVAELRKRLPGYAVPRYVREVPGMDHKIEL